MARQPRLNIAEGVYHVTQRGVEQRDIVVDDEDRQEWLRWSGTVPLLRSPRRSSADWGSPPRKSLLLRGLRSSGTFGMLEQSLQ